MFSNFIKLDLGYLKTKGIYILTALISVFLMVYIGFQIKLAADDEICIQVVDKQKVSVYTELSGYLFMDEECVIYPEGDYIYIPDAQKVGKYVDSDKEIAAVYKTDDVEKAERLKIIEEKIALLKECMVVNEGIIGSKEYDRDVKNAYNTIMSSARSGNLFALRGNTESWLLAQGKKNIAVSYVSNYNEEIARLESEKAQIVASFGEGIAVYTPKSGRYFESADGYEDYFSYELPKSGSYEDIHELLSGVNKMSAQKQGVTVCGKIMRSTKWYFVAEINANDLKGLTVGSSYTVEFEENNNKALPLTFERIVSDRESGRAYGVFSCMEMPGDFEYIRFQNVKVKTGEYEGLCVATSSVRYLDGELIVYIAKSDKIHLRKIKVMAEYGGMYIVKAQDDFTTEENKAAENENYLKRFDTLIISGKDLYDGKYIDMSELKE